MVILWRVRRFSKQALLSFFYFMFVLCTHFWRTNKYVLCGTTGLKVKHFGAKEQKSTMGLCTIWPPNFQGCQWEHFYWSCFHERSKHIPHIDVPPLKSPHPVLANMPLVYPTLFTIQARLFFVMHYNHHKGCARSKIGWNDFCKIGWNDDGVQGRGPPKGKNWRSLDMGMVNASINKDKWKSDGSIFGGWGLKNPKVVIWVFGGYLKLGIRSKLTGGCLSGESNAGKSVGRPRSW